MSGRGRNQQRHTLKKQVMPIAFRRRREHRLQTGATAQIKTTAQIRAAPVRKR